MDDDLFLGRTPENTYFDCTGCGKKGKNFFCVKYNNKIDVFCDSCEWVWFNKVEELMTKANELLKHEK
ncbi:MAG: hypothetical protein ACRCW9_04100 [Cetobacterium sp.]